MKGTICLPNKYSTDEQAELNHFTSEYPKDAVLQFKISETRMDMYAKAWDRWNPLYNDKEYAKKTKWGEVIAIPCFTEPLAFPPLLGDSFGEHVMPDYTYPGDGYDHEIMFYKPIFAGDEVRTYITENSFVDITPAEGSPIRGLILINKTIMLNQHNDCVAKGVFRWPEFRTHDKESVREYVCSEVNGDMPIWNHYERPPHHYTNEDWEIITRIWENEIIRGDVPLYWDEVQIGDMPASTTEGPVTQMDMIRTHGLNVIGCSPVRDHLLGKAHGPLSYENGIYLLDSFSHFVTNFGHRPQFFNTTGRNHIIRMLTNWCGDEGFLSKIGWRIINNLPNDRQGNRFPENFYRPSYLLKVPFLKEAGRYMNTHGQVPDTSISRGYVTDKYVRDGNYCVELACWCEDIEGNIFAEALAEIILPKR